MKCTSFCPPVLTGCIVQSFVLCQTGTFQNNFTMKTGYVSTEWGILPFHYFQLSFHHPLFFGTCHFLSLYLTLILFTPLIMLVEWIVHINSIKLPFHILLVSSIPILDISGNLILWFLDSPGFKIYKYLKINLVGFPSFSVVSGLGYIN